MPANTFYEVPVTVDVTASTMVMVSAGSPDEASDIALDHVRTHGASFSLDEGSIHHNEAYLPDPEEGAQQLENVVAQRGTDERLDGVSVVIADRAGEHRALVINGRLIATADGSGRDAAELDLIATNTANALNTRCKIVHCVQEKAGWAWHTVLESLVKTAPATETLLCEEFDRFCEREGLPLVSADDLLVENLTATQRAWLERFRARWEAVVES